jgi:hypothetical protein
MAELNNEDLRLILGADFEKKMQNIREHAAPTNPEERAASARRAADKLGDLQLTFVGLFLVGAVLIIGSLHAGHGISIQAIGGALSVLSGLTAIIFTVRKRRQLLAVPSGEVAIQ